MSLFPWVGLTLLFALALALRLYNLAGRSLWLDEVHTALLYAHLPSPVDVMTTAITRVSQMPLFFVFTWLLGRVGDDEFLLRLPSALFGAACVAAVFVLARRLFGMRVAFVAALLLSLMPYAVWLSQEARPYALLMLLTTLQMYYAYRAASEGRWVLWIGLAAATELNLYTHYFAWVATAAIALYLAGFIVSDAIRSRHARAILTVVGALLLGAAVVGVAGRGLLRPFLHEVADLAANPFWSSPAGWAAFSAALIALAGTYVVLRGLPGGAPAWGAAGAIAAITVALVAATLLTPRTDGHLQLPLAVASVVAIACLAAAFAALLSRSLPTPAATARLEGALGAGVLVAAGYAPWLNALHWFIYRSDQGAGRLGANELSLDDVASLLARLDISGVVVGLFLIGLITLTVWAFRGRAAEAGLVICWAAGPVVALGVLLGPRLTEIEPRYVAFLIPAAAIAAACGVEGIALAVSSWLRPRAAASRSPDRFTSLAAAVVAALAMVQVVPALAASYASPKDDYRAAAEHIAAASPPGSFVLALGTNSWWAADCMTYYMDQLHAGVRVIDSRRLNGENVADLASASGDVWGVLAFPSSDETRSLGGSSQASSEFVDVTGDVHVVRPNAGGVSAIEQATALLEWDVSQRQADLSSALNLLRLESGRADAGPDLVGPPSDSGWSFTGRVAAGGDVIQMSPSDAEPEQVATFSKRLDPGADLIVRFRCRSLSLAGWQGIYASALDASGNQLTTAPEGGVLFCPNRSTWQESFFAFTTPTGTASVQIFLHVHGVGVAQFGVPELRLLSERR
jgi:hypothetical protein